MMQQLAATPPKANSFLLVYVRTYQLGRASTIISAKASLKVSESFDLSDRGHKPWTARADRRHPCIARQHDAARAVLVFVYGAARVPDVVRLGLSDIDEGGFALSRARGTAQQKTGREAWCPIVPELAAEMAKWEKRPGPVPAPGSRQTRHAGSALANTSTSYARRPPAFSGATLHGLRATAVI